MSTPIVVLAARNQSIQELVDQCAKGLLPFSGPNSIWEKVAKMGYKPTGLYEMVRAAEAQLKSV